MSSLLLFLRALFVIVIVIVIDSIVICHGQSLICFLLHLNDDILTVAVC